jgi:uncharacterized protein YbaA (DUF1428 family)
MSYVDGFLLVVPKKKIKEYQRIAKLAGKVWKDHGAIDYVECVGDDMKVEMGKSFPSRVGAKTTEVVIFSWITYKNRAHRDRVLKEVMADKRLDKMMDPKKMPFDCKRMSYGGFKTLVEM